MNINTKNKNILLDSVELTFLFLKQNWQLLLFAFLFVEALHNHFNSVITQGTLMKSDSLRILGYLGEILTSLTEFLFFTMFVPLRVMEHDAGRRQTTFLTFTRQHILALTAEGLRATALVLLWSLAMIIPGLFKYLRYSFVPYVVVADPQYQAGKRDALQYSNDLVKGFTIQLAFILIGFTVFEMARSEFRESFSLLQHPAQLLLGGLLFFSVSLMTNILLFRLYQLRVKTLESTQQSP